MCGLYWSKQAFELCNSFCTTSLQNIRNLARDRQQSFGITCCAGFVNPYLSYFTWYYVWFELKHVNCGEYACTKVYLAWMENLQWRQQTLYLQYNKRVLCNCFLVSAVHITIPRKHKTLKQWWLDVGPPSPTLAQHLAIIVSKSCVCWVVTPDINHNELATANWQCDN